MGEPAQKPGRSKQDYGTPWALVHASAERWGPFVLDLAASAENAKAPRYITAEQDSLKQDWTALAAGGVCWLNPPFADIAPWAAKCAAETERGWRGVMLVPASIGNEWFARHVFGKAAIVGIRQLLAWTLVACLLPAWLVSFISERQLLRIIHDHIENDIDRIEIAKRKRGRE